MFSRPSKLYSGSTSPDALASRALPKLAAFPRTGASLGLGFGLAAKPSQP